MIVVSLLTEKPSAAQLNGLTYGTTVAADKAQSRASWNKRDLVLSLAIVLVIVLIFAYFSPLGIAG
jgi:SSS family solute:Na+ symporter